MNLGKHTTKLALISVTLIGFAIGANIFENSQQKKSTRLLSFRVEDVAKFRIQNFLEGLEFEKSNESWTVKKARTDLGEKIKDNDKTAPISTDGEKQPADLVKITKLLTNLSVLEAVEPVSTKEESLKKFQINAHSLHIQLEDSDGKPLGLVYIGKPGPSFASNFVKIGEVPNVYLISENLQGELLSPLNEWLMDKPKEGSQNAQGKNKNGDQIAGDKTHKSKSSRP